MTPVNESGSGEPNEDLTVKALRALWHRETEEVRSSDRHAATDDLSTTDPVTQLTVNWMQNAWSVESESQSSPELPDWVRELPPAKPRSTNTPRRLAIAGLVLATAASVAAIVWSHTPRKPNTPGPIVVASTSDAHKAAAPAPISPPAPKSTVFEDVAFTSRSDGIEVLTGTVRVVLVHPQSTRSSSTQR